MCGCSSIVDSYETTLLSLSLSLLLVLLPLLSFLSLPLPLSPPGQYQERENDVVTGSTQIRVGISYSADRAQTEGHKWHIHMNPSIDGQVCAGTIGGHYNPFSVSLGESSTSVHKLVLVHFY